MPYTYPYPRPALTVDCVVFGLDGLEDDDLKVLLIERAQEPFAAHWALPGGFVDQDEGLEHAARRELQEETGLQIQYLEQLYTFGAPGRDPRGHVVSVAWFALVRTLDHTAVSGSDAASTAWHSLQDLPPLAFDHRQIVECAHQRLQGKIRYAPIGFELLPEAFTLRQLQRLYEIVLQTDLDKRNFRRKILSMNVLEETGDREQNPHHRAARLYRFHPERCRARQASGLDFEL